jgi:hypothetical protein
MRLKQSISDYISAAREVMTSGELYLDMVEKRLIPECPTTITGSTMDAIYYAATGDQEASERAFETAANFKSQHGDPDVRACWLRGVLDGL